MVPKQVTLMVGPAEDVTAVGYGSDEGDQRGRAVLEKREQSRSRSACPWRGHHLPYAAL